MDIKQIRRDNALRIIKEQRINRSEFAHRIGKTPQVVSVYLRDNPTRSIGHKVAREIEKAFGLAEGWLDKPAGGGDKITKPAPGNIAALVRYAGQCARRYSDAQADWLKARRDSLRGIEDDFSDSLEKQGLQVTDIAGTFDYTVSNSRHQTRTINLFLPFPGFDGWQPPLSDSSWPDYLVVPLLTDLRLDYAIIPAAMLRDALGDSKAPLMVDYSNLTIGHGDKTISLDDCINRFDLL
ncbi:helix-turn-helix domain-containing protein [Kistimonas asteriae]|uniref:helix-turn-helix domain-containing protein n=1 Tax=Kistimonas asteriae TaxID=517724 RepID=UPI001BA6BD79|nr:helix-turn-helix transcriptional regulator [Kistimonas asteriae]